jgi:hypothetical protein
VTAKRGLENFPGEDAVADRGGRHTPSNCRMIGSLQIGFEFLADGELRFGVITVEAVQHLYSTRHLDCEEKILGAVSGSVYIVEQAAHRVRLGLGGDARHPIFLSTVNFA